MKRVLSLLPSATEIIYALGAGEQLVGVTHECDYPLEAQGKPQVTSARIDSSMRSTEIDSLVRQQLDATGTLYTLDMEMVRRLRPELVLTQQLCTVCAVGYSTVIEAMRSLPEPPEVINLEPRNLQEVFETFIEVGDRLGLPDPARKLVENSHSRLASIPALSRPKRVLFLEWLLPPFSAGHWMAELVEAAGAIAVGANRGEHSRQIDWESIESWELDAVVISCCGFDLERALNDVALCAELQRLFQKRVSLRLIIFDGNHYFSRPGPRLVESAWLLHHALAATPRDSFESSIIDPYVEIIPASLTPGSFFSADRTWFLQVR